MGDQGDDEARELEDAAAVHAAREDIARAVGELAARPLDEQAAERMRRALARASSARVRGAVRRITGTGTDRVDEPPVGEYFGKDVREGFRSRISLGRLSQQACRLVVPDAGGAG
jgi:hypothetical protein